MRERNRKQKRKVGRNEKCAICGLPRRKHNVLGHYFLKCGENIDQ